MLDFFKEIIFEDPLTFAINILEIIIVASLLYYTYKLLKGSVAINIFIGIILLTILWQIINVLDMPILENLFTGLGLGGIALIVVFQPEIRKFLLMLGSTNISKGGTFFEKINFFRNQKLDRDTTDINSVISACYKMSESKTGALIIIERSNKLSFLGDSGDKMNIFVNQPILESIFYKNSPLHDGAIIISNNIIKATRVVLPINNETKLSSKYGLRHRAAVSITEKTDAISIVVSEQNGKISYIKNGEFINYTDKDKLIKLLEKEIS